MRIKSYQPLVKPLEDAENLNFYVSKHSDMDTPCIFDGKLRSLGDIWNRIDASAFSPRYIVGQDSDPLMKANDHAWPCASAEEYDAKSCKNALEFILSFDASGVINGVYGHFTLDVDKGEEIGATYGWIYWVES